MTKVEIFVNNKLKRPIWGDNTSRKYDYRGSFTVSQSFTFYRSEAKEIIDSPLESVFEVLITRNSGIWFTGYFRKVDCKISEVTGEESVEVSFKKRDGYTTIDDFKSKEFDIIQDIGTPESVVNYAAPAAIQFYIAGSSRVTTVIGDLSYETEVSDPIAANELSDSGFLAQGPPFEGNAFESVIVVADHETDIAGRYQTGGLLNQIAIKDNKYTIVVDTAASEIRIRRYNGTQVLYSGAYTGNPLGAGLESYELIKGMNQGYNGLSTVLTNGQGQEVRVYNIRIWARILTNLETLNGVATTPINDDTDFVGTSYRYRIATDQLGIAGGFPVTVASATATSGYAQAIDETIEHPGQFFIKRGAPIHESMWYELSIFYDNSIDISSGDETINLRHAYRVEDVINKWLEWRNSEVRTKLVTDLYITPSTNITAGRYSIAAKKGLLSLDQLFRVTMHVLDKDYYISPDNEMIFLDRAEFENLDGFLDVTKLKEPRSGVSWDFKNKKYTYDVSKTPERIEFSFPVRSTDIFNGRPIINKSSLVEESRTEKVTLDFITDLQHVLINSAEVSRDAFVLLHAPNGAVAYKSINGLAVQNGELSWTAIHETYRLHYTPTVEVNGELKAAEVVKKYKKQTITLPNVKFVQLKGIITSLGKGKIESVDEKLESGQLTVTLLHND